MVTTKAFLVENGKLTKIPFADAPKARARKGAMLWVDIEDPTKKELQALVKQFGFHHLAVEDSGNMRQRCKVEDYDNFIFIVLRLFPKGEYEATQLNFFLDDNIVITTHFKCVEAVENVACELEKNPALLQRGPDYITYKIIDYAVDGLFPHLEEVESGLDHFEEEMLTATASQEVVGMLSRLFELKRRNLAIRKICWPMRDVLTTLSHMQYRYIRPENAVYFRDVYDHMLRITDITETNRELLSAMMEAYLATISNNLNVIMKKLTAIAGIFAAPVLIAGIYGMNFRNMPELEFEYGYYIALGEMFVASILMFLYFRINKWI